MGSNMSAFRAMRWARRRAQRFVRERISDHEFSSLVSSRELAEYQQELADAGLDSLIEAKRLEFQESVTGSELNSRGKPYRFGALGALGRLRWYALVRKTKPRVLVETGVCNGVSSAYILLALQMNGEGHLHSIDLPEYTDSSYSAEAFWSGKGGAAIPKGARPGWVIPEQLLGRWTFLEGRSYELLPPLLQRLGQVDFFFHDSEHSYQCMTFEYETALEASGPGTIIGSDDVARNTAFDDFCRRHGFRARRITPVTALCVVS